MLYWISFFSPQPPDSSRSFTMHSGTAFLPEDAELIRIFDEDPNWFFSQNQSNVSMLQPTVTLLIYDAAEDSSTAAVPIVSSASLEPLPSHASSQPRTAKLTNSCHLNIFRWWWWRFCCNFNIDGENQWGVGVDSCRYSSFGWRELKELLTSLKHLFIER